MKPSVKMLRSTVRKHLFHWRAAYKHIVDMAKVFNCFISASRHTFEKHIQVWENSTDYEETRYVWCEMEDDYEYV